MSVFQNGVGWLESEAAVLPRQPRLKRECGINLNGDYVSLSEAARRLVGRGCSFGDLVAAVQDSGAPSSMRTLQVTWSKARKQLGRERLPSGGKALRGFGDLSERAQAYFTQLAHATDIQPAKVVLLMLERIAADDLADAIIDEPSR